MKKFSFFLLLSGFIVFQTTAQKLGFIREDVIFRLEADHLIVSAELWFKNTGTQPVTQAVYIPFACEGSVYNLDSLVIQDCTTHEILKTFRQNIAGTMIQVSLSGLEQKKIKISYIQNHDRKRAGYILTKVKYWNKPLDEAHYTLFVQDPSIRLDSTSIKPDAVSTDNGRIKQSWRKYNFNPTKELCFYFHFE